MAAPASATAKDDKQKDAENVCRHAELYWDVDDPVLPNTASAYCTSCGALHMACNVAAVAYQNTLLGGRTTTVARPKFLGVVREYLKTFLELGNAKRSVQILTREIGQIQKELDAVRLDCAKAVAYAQAIKMEMSISK